MDEEAQVTPSAAAGNLVTPSAPAGNPIQDTVKGSATGRGPEVSGPGVTGPAVKAPARRRGPNASAIIVGLVSMLIAGLVVARETTGLRVDWSRLGPGTIVGIGVVMVVIGAIGLVRRHDDV
jgi:hypothetical protein